MNKRRLIPLFAAFVLWGSQYVISKIALRTVPPVTLLALRYLVSVPALFIVLRLRHALTPKKKATGRFSLPSALRGISRVSACKCWASTG